MQKKKKIVQISDLGCQTFKDCIHTSYKKESEYWTFFGW